MKRAIDILLTAIIAALLAVVILLMIAGAMNDPLTKINTKSARPAACHRVMT
jgi:lipopolysaccharide/colanic/teichoic acid biosynthesis glycosyltransferase